MARPIPGKLLRGILAVVGIASVGFGGAASAARVDRVPIEAPAAATQDGATMVGTHDAGFLCSPAGPCFAFSSARRCDAGICTDLPGDIFENRAHDVSEDGTVAVGQLVDSTTGELRATRWESGGLALLPTMAGATALDAAWGASEGGSTIVGESLSRPVRWVGAAAPEVLGSLGATIPVGAARAVSADGGIIVGFDSKPAGGFEAFRWESGTLAGLGDLSGGVHASRALALSGDGSVIVGYGTSAAGRRAVRWVGGSIEALDPRAHEAHGVSPNGVYIVGTGEEGAFRWDAVGGLAWVEDLLLAQSVPAGIPLLRGFAVSDDGQVMAGASTVEGFVVDLAAPSPVPFPLWALALAFLGVVCVARRGLRG